MHASGIRKKLCRKTARTTEYCLFHSRWKRQENQYLFRKRRMHIGRSHDCKPAFKPAYARRRFHYRLPPRLRPMPAMRSLLRPEKIILFRLNILSGFLKTTIPEIRPVIIDTSMTHISRLTKVFEYVINRKYPPPFPMKLPIFCKCFIFR